MQPTDTRDPAYYHKVVDCQWACPAHTPVPEYLRLIAQGRYADSYMVNWVANVFPGILGRTCDRPCEPACRRDRLLHRPGCGEPVVATRGNTGASTAVGRGRAAYTPVRPRAHPACARVRPNR